ncbi:arabinosyltransferase domain-containing protein [Gordonia sp. (in: high G+C Gram-positive bacteria)]|uniref:arabinosyltransferase domain-containing protein n=1 Tax=Gordonia sp. (in: high G+C Gram-positive bacteria) TaxID=84139 RepID=UPI00168F0ED7|nr:arabinosyltransferase domain-containing protein [Gordonia sp. (in: high G+C Gram-positive bacteria)]NLG48443.1 arabinosyltransferase [Gordonia sp. (in: high G+C Gram-positive bacteria)]
MVAGLLAVVAAVVTPLLPVSNTAATISWPQGQTLNADDPSIVAPLIAQTAKDIDITIDCRVLASLPTKATVLSTMPPGAQKAANKQLTVSATETGVTVLFRSNVAATASRADIAAGKCSKLRIFSSATATGAEFVGLAPAKLLEADKRPQVDGLFTTLTTAEITAAGNGIRANITIDNRYESTPSAIKVIAMIIAVLATLIALFALWCLDRIHGCTGSLVEHSGRFLTRLRLRVSDLAVGGILLLWTVLGAGAPDDGYILTMGRTAADAGYMANYYRFYGIAEAPFDWYYSFLARWAEVSPTIIWMHLPQLAAGIASWFILSRVVLPRLGDAVAKNAWAAWTTGAVFLAFWLPFCSGLRGEGIIVLGSLLTWWATELAISRRRMLPAALAATTAALTIAVAPQGIVGIAILLVAARPMLHILIDRRREAGLTALLAPIAAAATVVAVIVFRDQTLMTVLEAMKTRYQTGPIVPWHQEFLRYYFLSVGTPDGALARRIPVLLTFVAAFLVAAVLLRRGGIKGVASAPTWRLIGAFGVSLLLLFATPTKWTIQLGVLAGLGAALAGLAAITIAQSSARSLRNLAALTAGLLFALAAASAGTNAWPYAYNFGIPWFNIAPVVAGIEVSSVLLALAVVAVAATLWLHLRSDYVANPGLAHHAEGAEDSPADRRRIALASTPLLVIAALMVVATVVAFGRAAVVRDPAMTVASNNIDALTGEPCGMADQVLAEADPNAGMLTPADGLSATAALTGTKPVGFTPNGIPDDLSPDNRSARAGQMHVGGSTSKPFAIIGGLGAGTTGGRGPETVNGSTVALPFGLNPKTTPVLGSYGFAANAYLTTGWYDLPARDASPIIAFATAGAVSTLNVDGQPTFGQKLVAQFGKKGADGEFVQVGPEVIPIDPGPVIPNRPWRNLRIPMTAVPAQAEVMRLSLADTNLGPMQFIGITPPRAPELQTLQQLVGSEDPVLIDFPVAAHFPCQRPLAIRNGVAEVPDWRILPDYVTANSQSRTWMAANSGGLLAITEATTSQVTIPTYLRDDWHRDWGSLEKQTPLSPDAVPAAVRTDQVRMWGWSRTGSIRVEPTK